MDDFLTHIFYKIVNKTFYKIEKNDSSKVVEIEFVEQTSIQIERRRGIADLIRSYQVYVDGQHAGKLREDERCTVAVQPGDHEVILKVDWCSSPPVIVHVEAGETISLYCQSYSSVLAGLYLLVFHPKNYIQVFLG